MLKLQELQQVQGVASTTHNDKNKNIYFRLLKNNVRNIQQQQYSRSI